MAIIKAPNFSDKTADLGIERIEVTVGNEVAGGTLRRIPLREFLENLPAYTGNARLGRMLLPRDSKLIASAQACVLPVKDGEVQFHLSCFNYQSSSEHPAVMTIVASAQGTSVQVVDGKTTALLFNDAGKAVDFVCKRMADDRVARGVVGAPPTTMSAEERDRNTIYLISIPLKHPEPVYRGAVMKCASITSTGRGLSCATSTNSAPRGMDWGMVSKGTVSRGEYVGTRGLALERDDRFPIRVTACFYAVTDTPDVPPHMLETFAQRIGAIYSIGTSAGSLVTDGHTGRPTEHHVAPPPTGPAPPIFLPAPATGQPFSLC